MIVLETIEYLAKFPDRSGMLKAFVSGKSAVAGYAALKTEIENMAIHSLTPEVKGFVIGSDLDDVKLMIGQQSDMFMFFDYGEFFSNRNRQNSIENKWSCALTIATKMDGERDAIEFGLNSDTTLTTLRKIIVQMEQDQRLTSWLRQISDEYTLEPFNNKPLASYGWTMFFSRQGADMLNIKNL